MAENKWQHAYKLEDEEKIEMLNVGQIDVCFEKLLMDKFLMRWKFFLRYLTYVVTPGSWITLFVQPKQNTVQNGTTNSWRAQIDGLFEDLVC